MCSIPCEPVDQAKLEPREGEMKVDLYLTPTRVRRIFFPKKMTVKRFRELVCQSLQVDPEKTALICNGDYLEDDQLVRDYESIRSCKHKLYYSVNKSEDYEEPSEDNKAELFYPNTPLDPLRVRKFCIDYMEDKETNKKRFDRDLLTNLINNPAYLHRFTKAAPAAERTLEDNPNMNVLINNPQLLQLAYDIIRDEKDIEEMQEELEQIAAALVEPMDVEGNGQELQIKVEVPTEADAQELRNTVIDRQKALKEKRDEYIRLLRQAKLESADSSNAQPTESQAGPSSAVNTAGLNAPSLFPRIDYDELNQIYKAFKNKQEMLLETWKNPEMRQYLSNIAKDPELLSMCIPETAFAQRRPDLDTLQSVIAGFIQATEEESVLNDCFRDEKNFSNSLDTLVGTFQSDPELKKNMQPGDVYKHIDKIAKEQKAASTSNGPETFTTEAATSTTNGSHGNQR